MNFSWNKDKIKSMIQYEPGDISRYNNWIHNKVLGRETQEYFKVKLNTPVSKVNYASYNIKYQPIKKNLLRKDKICNPVPLIYFTMDSETKNHFNRLVENDMINFSSCGTENYTYGLIGEDLEYINISYESDLKSIRILAHELGHAMTMRNYKTVSDMIGYMVSKYMEVIPILTEMIFLDKAGLLLDKKDILSEQYRFLRHYQRMFYMDNVDKFDAYIHSYPVAHYLFDLYKNDYDRYKKIKEELITLMPNEDDINILKRLGIDNVKTSDSYQKYLKQYKSR